MYCIYCGAQLKPFNPQCPSCGRVQKNEPVQQPTPSSRVQVDWKRLGIILCIPLIILIGILAFNNSGSYEIKSHNGRYNRIEYRGSLEKLVNSDSYLLEQFLDGEVDGYENVRAIYCNDYQIEIYPWNESGGAVDLVDDHVTFYEAGLYEYNENTYTGTIFNRIRDDFVCIIKDLNSRQEYYFQSFDDISTWLYKRF